MSEASVDQEPDQIAGVPPPEGRGGVIGHDAVRRQILAGLAARRLGGAVLLHGPRGLGKATLAFDLAREIFILGGEEPARTMAQVAAGAHPNLRVLRRTQRQAGKGFYGVIRVEDVRALLDQARLTRARAGFRIVIVDAMDDCNAASSNALLKILEEPPPETVFFLIAHRLGAVLPTIRSRSRRFALRPLPDGDMRTVLGEGEGVAEALAFAGGRPRAGFEHLALSGHDGLNLLKNWLISPSPTASTLLDAADALAIDKDGAAFGFGRQALLGWVASEAAAAIGGRARLASATALWEKANLLFADADTYNLDTRQTLIMLLDAIARHVQIHGITSKTP